MFQKTKALLSKNANKQLSFFLKCKPDIQLPFFQSEKNKAVLQSFNMAARAFGVCQNADFKINRGLLLWLALWLTGSYLAIAAVQTLRVRYDRLPCPDAVPTVSVAAVSIIVIWTVVVVACIRKLVLLLRRSHHRSEAASHNNNNSEPYREVPSNLLA